MTHKILKVCVVGTGTLGAQIAIQSSFYGYKAACYDTDDTAFQNAIKRIENRIELSDRKPTLSIKEVKAAAKNVTICTTLGDALQQTDLVVECIPEDLELKRSVFKKIDSLAPPNAILATNSSSIPISQIENVTGRPEKCVNLHFYSLDLGRNMADIMGGAHTTIETIETCKHWIRSVGCVPLEVKKEIPGFFMNRISRAIKREALYLWSQGYAEFKDIDRAWMIYSGMSLGPFGIMDAVGLDVTYSIASNYYNESKDPRDYPPDALKMMVDRNELGLKSGKGFYTYPDPEYRNPAFLKN